MGEQLTLFPLTPCAHSPLDLKCAYCAHIWRATKAIRAALARHDGATARRILHETYGKHSPLTKGKTNDHT